MFVPPKRAEYAYKVTACNCLSTDFKHEAYGRPLLIVFNGCVYSGFHSFLLYLLAVDRSNIYGPIIVSGALIIILINTHHGEVATVDN